MGVSPTTWTLFTFNQPLSSFFITSSMSKWMQYTFLVISQMVIWFVCSFQGAWSEIFGKLIFFKLADMATFPTNLSYTMKKLQICISFASNLTKQCLCYILFYKWWKPHLVISKQIFCWFLLSNTDFVNKITHTKLMTQLLVPKSPCLKKVGEMRLWIGTRWN